MIIRKDNRKHELPALNTSSLPDLIFTVLFFFMLVTTMRSVPTKVSYQVPTGSNLAQLKKRPDIIYIMIGHNMTPQGKTTSEGQYYIQVNDKIVNVDQVADAIIAIKEQMLSDEQQEMTVVLKVDELAPMGVVNDVKMELRKADALKIHYSASQHDKSTNKKNTH